MVGYIVIQQYNLIFFGIFVEKGKKAVKNELTQIHEMETIIPMDTNKIIKKYRMEALSSLICLVKKR